MRSFYMRIFKNIICIYVLALCCFAYATMIHAIPDHVYVQEGQKLELDKKIPVPSGFHKVWPLHRSRSLS